MNNKLRSIFRISYFIAGLGILALLLYWRYQLGLVRYFDIDEFAYLHWTHNFVIGNVPYKDFLYFIPPGYLYALTPVFIFADSIREIFIYGRIESFLIFCLLEAGLFQFVRTVRDSRLALFSVIILAFLPLPYDKFLEIRPDTLAVAFSFWGMYFIALALKKKNTQNFSSHWIIFLSGILNGLAILIVPKIGLFPVLTVFVLLVLNNIRKLLSFGLGLFLPLALSFLYVLISSDAERAFYLVFQFSGSASKVLGAKFPLPPNFFFYPNDIFYAEGGFSLLYSLSLGIWLTGTIFSIFRFISFLNTNSLKSGLLELLTSLLFLTNLYVFLYLLPLKHAQYLIVLAPFIAFYFADLTFSILRMSSNRYFRIIFGGGIVIFTAIIIYQGNKFFDIKKYWTNFKSLSDMEKIHGLIPETEYIFDLSGGTVSYKDPYYLCCIPYGQYEEAFKFKLPDIRTAFANNQVKYISLSDKGRLSVLPLDQANFIKGHYVSYLDDPPVMVSGFEADLNRSEPKTFDIIIPGNYKIIATKKDSKIEERPITVIIDNIQTNGVMVNLSSGNHSISSDEPVHLTLRWQR